MKKMRKFTPIGRTPDVNIEVYEYCQEHGASSAAKHYGVGTSAIYRRNKLAREQLSKISTPEQPDTTSIPEDSDPIRTITSGLRGILELVKSKDSRIQELENTLENARNVLK